MISGSLSGAKEDVAEGAVIPGVHVSAEGVDALHEVIGVFGLPVGVLAAQLFCQNLCGAQGRLHGQGNTGTEDRIEKLGGVADQCETGSVKLFDPNRNSRRFVLAGMQTPYHQAGAAGVGIAGYKSPEAARRVRREIFSKKLRLGHNTHARFSVGKRDDPDPGVVFMHADPDLPPARDRREVDRR